MLTIEHEPDGTIITCLDKTGQNRDTMVILYEVDKVVIAQWDDEADGYLGLFMTYDMFKDISRALNLPEGVYVTEEETKEEKT